jgi:hypothetical protein
MTVKEWTDASQVNLERFGAIPALHTDKDWQSWGASLSNLSSLSGISVPNPYEFSDWRIWAERLNESLASVS